MVNVIPRVDTSILHAIIDPCCCGQRHDVDDKGMLLHTHHKMSIPPGFCEIGALKCDKCREILNQYFISINEPGWVKIKCNRSGCTEIAEVVSLETPASPRCRYHFDELRNTHPDLTCVPVERWLTEICPPNKEHPPHVGCWRGL